MLWRHGMKDLADNPLCRQILQHHQIPYIIFFHCSTSGGHNYDPSLLQWLYKELKKDTGHYTIYRLIWQCKFQFEKWILRTCSKHTTYISRVCMTLILKKLLCADLTYSDPNRVFKVSVIFMEGFYLSHSHRDLLWLSRDSNPGLPSSGFGLVHCSVHYTTRVISFLKDIHNIYNIKYDTVWWTSVIALSRSCPSPLIGNSFRSSRAEILQHPAFWNYFN